MKFLMKKFRKELWWKCKLSGLQGEMVKIQDKYRMVLRLDRLGCALLSVPISCVVKVKNS